jgi:hypothetical protein
MSEEKSIDQRIKEKRDKLINIHGSLALHMAKQLRYDQRAKAGEIQDRLLYRTQVFEEALLDEKLKIYQEVLDVLKD